MEFGKSVGDEHPDQQPHEQHQPRGVCWCGGDVDITVLLRSLIREELEEVLKRVILPHLPSSPNSTLPSSSSSLANQSNSSASRRWQLHFEGCVPETLLTMNKIEDEGASLEVKLFDEFGSRVEGGPESCMKIKIVVLDGDFEVEEVDDWTEEDFKKNVAKPRKDKGPLLKGKCDITMSGGIASVSDISFTDNSKSMRNGSFRLGAQVVKGLPPGVVVRPAVSAAFKVKECRLKHDRKHKIPSPQDKLSRLVNISNSGAVYKRAVDAGIHTVKDFLQLYHTDSKAMEDILQVPPTKWKEIVKNAEACLSTNEHYRYYDDISGVDLLFDCLFNIKSVTFKGQSSRSYESLDDLQREEVNKLRRVAYGTRSELELFILTNQISMQPERICSSSKEPRNIQHLDGTATDQGELLVHHSPVCGSSPGTLPYSFQHYCWQPEASTSQVQDLDQDWFNSWNFSPLLDERGNVSGASSNDNTTRKLPTAFYVTKALTMFMIFIWRGRRGRCAPKKKRKVQ